MMPGSYNPTVLRHVNVIPQEDRILVRPDPDAGKTEGGVLLPDQARGKPTKGQIIAVGPGRVSQEGTRIEMPFKVGQQVLYAAYSETAIKVDGEELLILKVPDIFAVVEPIEVEEPVQSGGQVVLDSSEPAEATA